MMKMCDYKELIDELNKKRNVSFVGAENDDAYNGQIELLDGRTVNMRIIFPSSFPLKIPVFYVETERLEFLHTDSSGKMCLFEENSLLLNQDDSLEILLECFDKAYEILNISRYSAKYQQEIRREFGAYWGAISKRHIYSCIDTETIGYSECIILGAGNKCVLTESENDGKYLLYNYFDVSKAKECFSKKCLLIRLRENASLPKIRGVRWRDVRNYIFSNASSSQKRRFKNFCNIVLRKDSKLIFLILPSSDGDILFGYEICVNNKRYTKFENCVNTQINPIYITRLDKKFLLKRAGADSVIHDKRILLMGCGSVGGFIADNLCAAGIENLDLLDYDDFMPENVHRHFLGIDSALKGDKSNKADLLKEKLEEKYLHTAIDSLGYKDRTAEAFITDTAKLEQYDLIVSALGEPTLNLEIDKILHRKTKRIPFIVCFNEPYGIGGHVIVSNLTNESCLRCLYTDVTSSELVEFRGSFVKSNQSFKKNISGCGSAFVPYSRLDSQQTAIIATRTIIDVLDGRISHNVVNSWVGEDDLLKAAGKKESIYYTKFASGSVISKETGVNQYCPICGDKG